MKERLRNAMMKNGFEKEPIQRNVGNDEQREAMRTAQFLQKMRTRLGLKTPSARYEQTPIAVLLSDLSSRDWTVRVQAVRELERWDKEIVCRPLLQALADPEPAVRAAAARAIGTWGREAPPQELLDIVYDPAWNVRASAIQALGKMKQPALLDIFLSALATDEHTAVRVAALWALAHQSEKAPIEPLILALQDGDVLVRATAASTLAGFGMRAPIRALVHALDDEEECVRTAVTGTLEQLSKHFPDQIPVEFLLCSLQHHDEMVRATAACALGDLKVHASIGLLVRALRDESTLVREAAAQSLKDMQHSQLSNSVTRILRLPEPEMRVRVWQALELLRRLVPASPLIAIMQAFLGKQEEGGQLSWYEVAGKVLLVIHCCYENLSDATQEAVASLVEETAIEQFAAALQDADGIVRALAQQAQEILNDAPEMGCLLGVANFPNCGKDSTPVKVVLSCMSKEQPRRDASGSWCQKHRAMEVLRSLKLTVMNCHRKSLDSFTRYGVEIKVWYAPPMELSTASAWEMQGSCWHLSSSLRHQATRS
jgi:HEAT repeat protein